MGRPRRAPAFLVDATVHRNPKLAALPNDTARLGYFYVVLGGAKLAEPVAGQFASRAVFREVAGRFARYLGAYLSAGLLEEAPDLCGRCRIRWSRTPPRDGALLVHDWLAHQFSPGKLERDRAYEAAHPGRRHGNKSGAVSGARSGAVSGPVSDGISGARTDGRLTRDRARARESNVELRTREAARSSGTREDDGLPVLLTAEQLRTWRSFTATQWAPFREAWLGRGFRHPPFGSPDDDDSSQRGLLWSIAEARPTDLARWVAEAPGKSPRQVIAYVLRRWRDVRAEAAP